MNKLLILLVALSLSGCQLIPVKTEIQEVPQEVTIIHPSRPAAFDPQPVQFQVWNKERLQQAAANANEDTLYFVLDEPNAKNLGNNINNLTGVLTEYRNQLDYYRNGLLDYNARVRAQVEKAKSK